MVKHPGLSNSEEAVSRCCGQGENPVTRAWAELECWKRGCLTRATATEDCKAEREQGNKCSIFSLSFCFWISNHCLPNIGKPKQKARAMESR